MDVCATTGTGYITTHVLVESRHNDVACIVADILAAANGYRRALCAAYAENEYIDAFLTRFLCCLQCSAFMVFAISDEYDSLAYTLLLSETACCYGKGTCNVGTLSRDECRTYAMKEHLC